MGTRHITAVKLNGEYKIAQYGQWDGYPEGQGQTALKFLRSPSNREKLKKGLKHCVFVTPEEIEAKLKEMGLSNWMTTEEANRFNAEFPYMTRDHGAEILRLVATAPKEARPIKITNSLEFAADSLFCEWAYVVDFDTNTFEVYRGFNKEPLPEGERFAGLPKSDVAKGKYYPVKFVKSYKLGRLPAVETFLKQIRTLTRREGDE
jgi:hypothetical protein